MKVAMVDQSAFTPPYDHHLCAGLAKTGCELTLFTTDSDYFLWDGDTSYRRLAYFYSHTNDRDQRNRAYRRYVSLRSKS